MKLKQYELAGYLQRQMAPVFCVSGDEPLLIEETAALIRAHMKGKGCDERQFFQINPSFDWQALRLAVNNQTLFSNKTLIELRFLSDKLPEAAKKALLELISDFPADKWLLLICPKLPRDQLATKLFKAIDQQGVIIQVWPIPIEQLPRWSKQRFQQYGLTIDDTANNLLIEYSRNNLLALKQEIEKLALLYSKQRLTEKEIVAAIADNARFDVFELVDYCLQGDMRHVVRVFNNLRSEGVELTLVLWALMREIRQLANMAIRVETGVDRGQVLVEQKIWDKRKPLLIKAMGRHNSQHWLSLVRKASEIDYQIKSGSNKNIWDPLMDLAMGIGK